MNAQEIKEQIEKIEKRIKNPILDDNAKKALNNKLDKLKSDLKELEGEAKKEEKKVKEEVKKTTEKVEKAAEKEDGFAKEKIDELNKAIEKHEKALKNPIIDENAKAAIKKKLDAAKEELKGLTEKKPAVKKAPAKKEEVVKVNPDKIVEKGARLVLLSDDGKTIVSGDNLEDLDKRVKEELIALKHMTQAQWKKVLEDYYGKSSAKKEEKPASRRGQGKPTTGKKTDKPEKESTKFKRKYKFNSGDIVWDKKEKEYAVVLNNYDDPENGSNGEIRLDTNGNVMIFQLDDDFKEVGYRLVPLGSPEDKGNKTQLAKAEEAHEKWADNYGYPKKEFKKPATNKEAKAKPSAEKPKKTDSPTVEIKGKTLSVEDCKEVLEEWEKRRNKAKASQKKSNRRSVSTRVAANAVQGVETAVNSVPAEEIAENPEAFIKKVERLKKAAKEFLDAFKAVLGDEYSSSDINEEFDDLDKLIKDLMAKYED